MKKYVSPAVAGAKIPDPVMGDDLPAEGRTVDWSPHWQRYADLGEINVIDVAPQPGAGTPPPPAEDQPAAPDAPARKSRYAPPAPKLRDEPSPADGDDTPASAD